MRYAAIGLLALAGCASSSAFTGPDGRRYVHVSCPGAAVPMSACFEEAARQCPGGYAVVQATTDTTGYLVHAYGVTPMVDRALHVRCN